MKRVTFGSYGKGKEQKTKIIREIRYAEKIGSSPADDSLSPKLRSLETTSEIPGRGRSEIEEEDTDEGLVEKLLELRFDENPLGAVNKTDPTISCKLTHLADGSSELEVVNGTKIILENVKKGLEPIIYKTSDGFAITVFKVMNESFSEINCNELTSGKLIEKSRYSIRENHNRYRIEIKEEQLRTVIGKVFFG